MATDIFTGSHRSYLLSLSRARFRFDAKSGRLRLYLDRVCELPPNWVRALRVEFVGEDGKSYLPPDLVWEELEDSLMISSCACPDVYRPRDFSQDFVPIAEVILTAGGDPSIRLPNTSSPSRFGAREPNRDPDEDHV